MTLSPSVFYIFVFKEKYEERKKNVEEKSKRIITTVVNLIKAEIMEQNYSIE